LKPVKSKLLIQQAAAKVDGSSDLASAKFGYDFATVIMGI
jgi:hypothetical protein